MRLFTYHRTLLRIGPYELKTTSDPVSMCQFSRGGEYAHIYGVWKLIACGFVLTRRET